MHLFEPELQIVPNIIFLLSVRSSESPCLMARPKLKMFLLKRWTPSWTFLLPLSICFLNWNLGFDQILRRLHIQKLCMDDWLVSFCWSSMVVSSTAPRFPSLRHTSCYSARQYQGLWALGNDEGAPQNPPRIPLPHFHCTVKYHCQGVGNLQENVQPEEVKVAACATQFVVGTCWKSVKLGFDQKKVNTSVRLARAAASTSRTNPR